MGFHPDSFFTLVNIKAPLCHEKSSSKGYLFFLRLLGGLVLLAAGPILAQTPAAPRRPEPPPPDSIPKNEWRFEAEEQETNGNVHKLRRGAWVENNRMLFRADEMEWDQETGDVRASGSVYFHDFARKEELWCDRLEYNTDEETGKFFKVRGQTVPRIITRPGMLTSSSPFYFEGEWAERIHGLYVLHNGFFTNCKMPSPWWRLRGPKFEIEPGKKAVAYQTRFLLRGVPIFYTPFFYHSLQPQPRKSGFLMPNLGNSSRHGVLLGAGYYWAINQSYDATYRIQDYASRAFAHNVDLRGKPREGSDFYTIVSGVQDRGSRDSGGNVQKFSGLGVYGVGRSELGGGWNAHADVNYITSFRFRQEWTESYNEVIGSEIQSVGFLNKSWSSYNFDAVFARRQNFQSSEKEIRDPATGAVKYVADAVTIRKLPEAEFAGRDRQIWSKLPVWIAFDASAGLLHRSEPVFDESGSRLIDKFETGQFMNRVNFAPRVMGALRFKGINLAPALTLHDTYYSEGQAPFQDRFRVTGTNIVRNAREFSLDIAFPSLARVYQKKTIFGDRLKHVIEPRATYRYVTGIGSDFNQFIRFDETDLLSDTNEVRLSLTNRVYARRGDSVEEILTWELSQKRYFDPTFGGALVPGQRNVFESTADLAAYAFVAGPRGASPVVSLLRMSPAGALRVDWQSEYDPRMRGIVDSMLTIDYRWNKFFVGAGNSQVHVDPALGTPAANQYRFRVGAGDANRRGLNAYVDGRYDYRKGLMQDITAQVAFNTDCCGLSVQYHHWVGISGVNLIPHSVFRVSFAIANIGSFGTLKKQERLF